MVSRRWWYVLPCLAALCFARSARSVVTSASVPHPPDVEGFSAPAAPGQVLSGLDVLEADHFRMLEGRRIGIVCNETAVDHSGRHIVDVLASDPKIRIMALFGPEHGIRGTADESVASSIDRRTGLRVYSLYNTEVPARLRYRPTPAMLRGIDTLVFDIQDIGSRYYTYITTLGYVLEAAAPLGIRVVVLDRPNPLGGMLVEGPDLDLRFHTLAGYHNMPVTHGMTIGELALLFNAERHIGASIQVVKMQGWNRQMLFDETGLPWVNPSPNIRSVREAALYPALGFLEDLPVSVGRGTPHPFEVIGAPWIDGDALAAHMNSLHLPGVAFESIHFIPRADEYTGDGCRGIRVLLLDRRRYRPTELGIYLANALARLFPGHIGTHALMSTRQMIGNEEVPQEIAEGVSPQSVVASWSGDVARWYQRRAPYLLYP